MDDWMMISWQGPPEASAAALHALGWHGPEEVSSVAMDGRVGGFIPAIGTSLQTFDGIAYVAVAANAAIDTPPGLASAGPELFRALFGGF